MIDSFECNGVSFELQPPTLNGPTIVRPENNDFKLTEWIRRNPVDIVNGLREIDQVFWFPDVKAFGSIVRPSRAIYFHRDGGNARFTGLSNRVSVNHRGDTEYFPNAAFFEADFIMGVQSSLRLWGFSPPDSVDILSVFSGLFWDEGYSSFERKVNEFIDVLFKQFKIRLSLEQRDELVMLFRSCGQSSLRRCSWSELGVGTLLFSDVDGWHRGVDLEASADVPMEPIYRFAFG